MYYKIVNVTVCLDEVHYCMNVLSEKSWFQIIDNIFVIFRKMRSHQVRTGKQRMPLPTISKVNTVHLVKVILEILLLVCT